MPDKQTTASLLDLWVRKRSESAFAGLVERYSSMVYATALRSTGGRRDLSADISQQVFVALAEKAPALEQDERLGGWLHQRTAWTASKMLRSERRRQKREQLKAMSEPTSDEQGTDPTWEEWTPYLDAALRKLSKGDRDAIVLRFFEGQDLRSVGEALGSSEDAARKRVSRGLEKLRKLIGKKGITLSAGGLLAAMSQSPASAAEPAAALVNQWNSTALANANTSGMTALFYRWLSPVTSVGIGAAVALVSASIIRGEDQNNQQVTDETPLSITPASPSTDSQKKSNLPPGAKAQKISNFTLAEFIRELETVLDLPESGLRAQQIYNLLKVAPEMDPLDLGRAIFAEIDPLKLDSTFAQDLNYHISNQVPDRDRFLFFVNEWPLKSQHSAALRNAFGAWMEDEPEQAIAWLKKIREDGGMGKLVYAGRKLTGDFLGDWCRHVRRTQGVEEALKIQIEWVNSGDAELSISDLRLESEADFRAAWNQIRQVEAPRERRMALYSVVDDAQTAQPELARKLIESVSDPNERSDLVRDLISREFGNNTKDGDAPTAEWFLEQTIDTQRDKILGEIASRWIFSGDQQAAIGWIESHPELQSTRALEELGRVFRQENWGSQPPLMSEEELAARAELLPRIQAIWSERQPAAAATFQQKSEAWLSERGFEIEK